MNTAIKGMQEHRVREAFEEKYEKEIKVTKISMDI